MGCSNPHPHCQVSYKRKYTSKSFSIKNLLEKQDRKVFSKVSGIDRHPLRGLLPKKKVSTYNKLNKESNKSVSES